MLLCIFDSEWIDSNWTTQQSLALHRHWEMCVLSEESLWTVMWTPQEMKRRLRSFSTDETIKAKKQPSVPLPRWIHGCISLDNNFSLSTRSVSPYQVLHVAGDVQRGREEEEWWKIRCSLTKIHHLSSPHHVRSHTQTKAELAPDKELNQWHCL